jgi:hypothetical protein
MRDPHHHPRPDHRPESAESVIEAQTRALQRRQMLAEQQRTFQSTYPHPHLLRRRPPA